MKKENLKASVVPANPVELMAGWMDFMYAICVVTFLFGLMGMFRADRGPLDSMMLAGLPLVVFWLPFFVADLTFMNAKDRIARVHSTYASSKSVFADGIRQGIARCRHVPFECDDGHVIMSTVVYTTVIMICNIWSLFDFEKWYWAIAVGCLLSIFGLLWVTISLARDYIRETWRMRRLI